MLQAYNLHNSELALGLCHHNFSPSTWPVTPASGEHDPQAKAAIQLDVTSEWEEVFSFFSSPFLSLLFPVPEQEIKMHTNDLTIHACSQFLCILHMVSSARVTCNQDTAFNDY